MAGRLTARRRGALALLAALLAAAHLWLADTALHAQFGWGAARDARPARIEVAFVRELAPAVPAAPAAPVAAPPPPRPVVAPAAPAASAPEPPPEPPPQPPPKPPEPPAPAVVAVDAPVPMPESPAAAVAAAVPASTAQAWPPSTRLSYALTGNYRGPIEGQAQVEWLLAGTRYQVHLDVSVGPAFAPLLSRRHSSQGELTDKGLRPSRYDEEFKVIFREPRRLAMQLDGATVRWSNGRSAPRPDGVQDSASQFVQLVWLFSTQPALLAPGSSIDIPLALPRYVETWPYDVLALETLATPAGAIETVHVKPRREPRPGVDLTAEMWVAPALQNLPVRLLIRQDAETYVDLLIKSLPLQAAPAAAGR
jgi:hypothetical protein